MPVLVTGATGVIGRALVPRLIESGGQVRVYVRREVPEYRSLGVHVSVGEADHEGRLESALEQVHTLVHLIGGPIPGRGVPVEWLNEETVLVALRAAGNAEVARFVFLSPLGADPGSTDRYLAAKGRAEEAILDAPIQRAIFRCAPVLAPGSALATFLSRGIPSSARDVRMNPVTVEDVVSAIVAADTREGEVRGEWELGGPEVLSLGDLVELTGAKARRLSLTQRELTALYARDTIADPSRAVELFGLTLTPAVS
jgi:NADH dehydrogenase